MLQTSKDTDKKSNWSTASMLRPSTPGRNNKRSRPWSRFLLCSQRTQTPGARSLSNIAAFQIYVCSIGGSFSAGLLHNRVVQHWPTHLLSWFLMTAFSCKMTRPGLNVLLSFLLQLIYLHSMRPWLVYGAKSRAGVLICASILQLLPFVSITLHLSTRRREYRCGRPPQVRGLGCI